MHLYAGLSGHTTKAHIARAALEAVAHQSKEILDAMTKDARKVITEKAKASTRESAHAARDAFAHADLRVDGEEVNACMNDSDKLYIDVCALYSMRCICCYHAGGMTANNLLLQFQSDVTRRRVVRPVIAETTALGAAYAAGLAVGFWSSLDELRSQWAVSKTWTPEMSETDASDHVARWNRAVQRTLNWASPSGSDRHDPDPDNATNTAAVGGLTASADTAVVDKPTSQGAIFFFFFLDNFKRIVSISVTHCVREY
jgi:glycerol kinase